MKLAHTTAGAAPAVSRAAGFGLAAQLSSVAATVTFTADEALARLKREVSRSLTLRRGHARVFGCRRQPRVRQPRATTENHVAGFSRLMAARRQVTASN